MMRWSLSAFGIIPEVCGNTFAKLQMISYQAVSPVPLPVLPPKAAMRDGTVPPIDGAIAEELGV